MLRYGIEAANMAGELGLESGEYALVTLHRPSNVDAAETLKPIVDALVQAAESLPIVFVGAAIVIASNLIIVWRERSIRRSLRAG